jgi:hypothetical protein
MVDPRRRMPPQEPPMIRAVRIDDTFASAYRDVMRTTVTLDDDVHEAALAHARATGQRLGRVLSEMARQAFRNSPPAPGGARRRRSRFAQFEVPAGARLIPASRVQKALDEEGIV